MNVRQLIEELQKQDPELQVRVGVPCSCYGVEEATEVTVEEAFTIGDIVRYPKHVFIE